MRSAALFSALALFGCAQVPLPDPYALNLREVQGERLSLSSMRGKVVLVHFFATWCFPCLSDVPRLNALQDSRGKDGLQVVGIGLDLEGPTVLDPFKAYYQLHYPVLVGGGRFAEAGEPFAPVTVLPTTVILSRDGKQLARWEGPLPEGLLEKVVAHALAR